MQPQITKKDTDLYSWRVISTTSSFNVEVFVSAKSNRTNLVVELFPSKIVSLAFVHFLKLLASIILIEESDCNPI